RAPPASRTGSRWHLSCARSTMTSSMRSARAGRMTPATSSALTSPATTPPPGSCPGRTDRPHQRGTPMVQRQLPNPVELLELMKFKKPALNGRKRRLDAALTIDDLRTIANRRTPKAAFDYTDGAAEGELSLARARQAFEDVEFHPGILRPAPTV